MRTPKETSLGGTDTRGLKNVSGERPHSPSTSGTHDVGELRLEGQYATPLGES